MGEMIHTSRCLRRNERLRLAVERGPKIVDIINTEDGGLLLDYEIGMEEDGWDVYILTDPNDDEIYAEWLGNELIELRRGERVAVEHPDGNDVAILTVNEVHEDGSIDFSIDNAPGYTVYPDMV